MHKIVLGIAVLGVAATVGAVIAVKNNTNLQDKAEKAAEKAAAKAKETADSLAKMVKNIGVGSCVETSSSDDEDYCDDDFSDLEEDDSEEDEEFNKVDSAGSLRDLISPEAKEYAKKLENAFSSAFKAFDDAMKDTTAPEGTTTPADEAEKPEDEVEVKETAVKIDITKAKTSEEPVDKADTYAESDFAEDEGYDSPAPDVNADADIDDNATPDETDEAQISEPVADAEDSEADTTDVIDIAEVPGFQTNGFVTFDTIEGGEEDD